MTTVFVTITLADADHWPAVNAAAGRLGATAAVLQGDGPTLVDRLNELAHQGERAVTLVGVTLGETGVPTSWIGHVARWWLAANPDTALVVSVVPRALRELPNQLPDSESKPIRANADGLTNTEWAAVPPVHTQVLVCRGPRCAAKGAERLLGALGAELHSRGLLDEDVLVTQTGCLYPCNLAPVVALQPDMEWFGPLGEGDLKCLADRLERDGARRASTHEPRSSAAPSA